MAFRPDNQGDEEEGFINTVKGTTLAAELDEDGNPLEEEELSEEKEDEEEEEAS